MIMEGLETLVTPSHHAYLLTESAAAAHFNVLSFDTCSLFKTAATTASSFNLNNNNNNHTTANNNHHPSQTQLISSQSHQQQMQQQSTTQHNQQQANTVNTSSNSSIITSSHSSTSVTQTSKTDSIVVSSSAATITTTSTSGHHSHPTLNIHETQQQTADRSQHQQTGDLNTPVTTSSDIPSFFGPSTVVEPPIITGECCFIYAIDACSCKWSCMLCIRTKKRDLSINQYSHSDYPRVLISIKLMNLTVTIFFLPSFWK